jgi:hypothetical protein
MNIWFISRSNVAAVGGAGIGIGFMQVPLLYHVHDTIHILHVVFNNEIGHLIRYHRSNMDLDLQSLFGLRRRVYRPRNSLPPPAFGLIYDGAIGRPR